MKNRQLLISLKAAAGLPGPQLGLLVEKPHIARLRAVATQRNLQNPADVSVLTEWRNQFVNSFLTEFTATDDQTSRWLENVVGPDDKRILFMVDNLEGLTVGYMGLSFIDWETGYAEADSIVRGRAGQNGLMTGALQVMLLWARGQLGLKSIGVRVRSDNPALAFYKKFGFVETKRVPLSNRRESGTSIWFENSDEIQPAISLVHHNLPE